MGLFARIFGICRTRPPEDDGCWTYSGGNIHIELKRMPEISKTGGAVRLEGKGLPEKILLVCGDDGNLYAFGNRCTHMGRRLDHNEGTGIIQCCSVFGSTFDYTGEAVGGPAKEPLKTFPVKTEEGGVIISLTG